MLGVAKRHSRLLRFQIAFLVAVVSLLLCVACGKESELAAVVTREMRRMMMSTTTNVNSTARAALSNNSSSSNTNRIPGLPDLPDANAPLKSVKEDAEAAVVALRKAVTYDGRKKPPSREPVWRPGVSSHGGAAAVFAAATAATSAAAAATARADGGGSKASSTEIPEGILVEEYEVLSEERETTSVDGRRGTERLWVPLTVARPSASSISEEEEKASTSSSSSYPALFLLHSTAGSRAKTRARLLRAAERGYVALAPEFRYFGTRGRLWEPADEKGGGGNGATTTKAKAKTTAAEAKLADFALYESELVRAYRSEGAEERPFLLDNCWDLQRVLDWLFFVGTDEEVEVVGSSASASAKEDDEKGGDKKGRRRKLFRVDPARVGTTGISLGGMHSVLFGVLEPRRIAVMAPAIGVPTFAWGAAHGAEWESRAASIPEVFSVAAREGKEGAEKGKEKPSSSTKPTAQTYVKVLNAITPGLLGPYDASRSLAALAPRPLLIANGGGDGRNPLGALDNAVERARKVYELESKGDNLEYFLDPRAEHEYTPVLEEKVDSWLDGWLLRK